MGVWAVGRKIRKREQMVTHPISKKKILRTIFAVAKFGNVNAKGGQTRLPDYSQAAICMIFYIESDNEENNYEESTHNFVDMGSTEFRPGLPIWIGPDCKIIFWILSVKEPYATRTNDDASVK